MVVVETQRTAQEALRRAELAQQRIDDHEELCATRYANINFWLKMIATILGASALGLIAALWQVALRLAKM